MWRVRGHLVSNRDFWRPKFFNPINSLWRIATAVDALAKSSRVAQTTRGNRRKELGYFGGRDSKIGTEQRVTVTRVGPCEPGTETSSERHPVR